MKAYFEQRAAYNRWANARLYEAAFSLSEADYRRDVGAFFKSMHGTLNHLLLTDRLWLKRLTGEGEHPNKQQGHRQPAAAQPERCHPPPPLQPIAVPARRSVGSEIVGRFAGLPQ